VSSSETGKSVSNSSTDNGKTIEQKMEEQMKKMTTNVLGNVDDDDSDNSYTRRKPVKVDLSEYYKKSEVDT